MRTGRADQLIDPIRTHHPVPRKKQTILTRDNRRCAVSINAYARRIGVSLGSKNRLARIDPIRKMKPSAISAVPARATVDSRSFASATEGAPGVVDGTDESAMSLSSVDAAKSISTSTERGVAWSAVGGSMVGWAAMGAAGAGVAASRAGTEFCIDRLGRGRHRLRRGRRGRVQQLSPRIKNHLFTRCGLVLFRSDGSALYGMMMDQLLHRNLGLVGLEPAFPVTIETVDPVLAGRRRLAWLLHTLRLGGSRRGGLFRGGVEQVG